MKELILKADDVTRRKLVKGMAASLLGVHFVPHITRAQSPTVAGGAKAKSVIFIRVTGGLSHVDSFDIKEENKDAIKASEPIKTNADGIRIGKYFPRMARHMDKFALINSMSHTQGTHDFATYQMDKGYEKRGTVVHPDLGAWVAKLGQRRSGDIPPFIKVGSFRTLGAGFFTSEYASLPIKDPQKGLQFSKLAKGVSQPTFDRRLQLMNFVNQEYKKKLNHKISADYHQAYADAVKLMKSKDLEVFDISREKSTIIELYGENLFGQSCLLARRLVEQGVSFIQVTHDGWDDHYTIYKDFGERAQSLDQGVSALVADLQARGLLDSTLIVFATEFGREAELNKRAGRGHNPVGYTNMLAGGGVKGGQKYGKTDSIGRRAIENKVGVDDFNATIAYAMGLPLQHVEMSPGGRPFKVGDNGKPLTALF